jgi:hypothetical protein
LGFYALIGPLIIGYKYSPEDVVETITHDRKDHSMDHSVHVICLLGKAKANINVMCKKTGTRVAIE